MLVGMKVSPHDLRRHAATYASQAGTPIEIVSKLILRHSNLSTTQRYLGRISDVEALRWSIKEEIHFIRPIIRELILQRAYGPQSSHCISY
ncbi:MAG: site-specific integrase [Deltaproteobacteria bacterium]|nr:site-specific integrase [Deltaproteobacteria bacterium]